MNMDSNSINIMNDLMNMTMVWKLVSVERVVVVRINIIYRSIKHNHKSLDMEDGELHIEESDCEMTIQQRSQKGKVHRWHTRRVRNNTGFVELSALRGITLSDLMVQKEQFKFYNVHETDQQLWT